MTDIEENAPGLTEKAKAIESMRDVPYDAPYTSLTPMAMIGQAISSGASVEILDKLLNLQERWDAIQARKAYDAAMAEARAEIKPVIKTRTATFDTRAGQTSYQYEDLALVAEAVDPILAKHGLSYTYKSRVEGQTLYVTCIVAHRLGHREETTLPGPFDTSGSKNPIQAIGSSVTYLQRYTLKLALGLAAARDDDAQSAWPKDKNGGSLRTITEEEVTELRNLLEAADRDAGQLLAYVGAAAGSDLAQLSEAQFLKGKAKCIQIISEAKEP